MKVPLQKVYPITDSKLSGLSIVEQVKQFIDGGATLIQIREKSAPSGDFFRDVSEAIKIAHEAGVVILVNDRVDIALMSGADGVHLGQDDIPISAARRILGEKSIIGVSTHNGKQVLNALSEGFADYIAFGPIFATSTKIDHEPLVSLEKLAKMRNIIGDRCPLVGIGGINVSNLVSVIEAGADSAAMISEFYNAGTAISSQFRALLRIADSKNTVLTS